MNQLSKFQFIYKALFMLILSASSFQSSATSCIITGTVNASSSPCSTLVDTIIVKGSITMDATLSYNFDVVFVLDSGNLNWTTNCDLKLTASSQLDIINKGFVQTTGKGGGACNSQKNIYFGSTSVISCNGGGRGILYSFADINLVGSTFIGNPLPVSLIEFKAERKDDRRVDLNWKTAQEVNCSHFDLELYTMENWAKIAEIPGKGNSNAVQEYSYMDLDFKSGVQIYRLKQIDYDGNFEYLGVVVVENAPKVKREVLVFPNPVTKGNSIDLAERANVNYTYKVLSSNGKLILSGKSEEGNTKIETQLLPVGIYFIEVSFSDGDKNCQKVAVQ